MIIERADKKISYFILVRMREKLFMYLKKLTLFIHIIIILKRDIDKNKIKIIL